MLFMELVIVDDDHIFKVNLWKIVSKKKHLHFIYPFTFLSYTKYLYQKKKKKIKEQDNSIFFYSSAISRRLKA